MLEKPDRNATQRDDPHGHEGDTGDPNVVGVIQHGPDCRPIGHAVHGPVYGALIGLGRPCPSTGAFLVLAGLTLAGGVGAAVAGHLHPRVPPWPMPAAGLVASLFLIVGMDFVAVTLRRLLRAVRVEKEDAHR